MAYETWRRVQQGKDRNKQTTYSAKGGSDVDSNDEGSCKAAIRLSCYEDWLHG